MAQETNFVINVITKLIDQLSAPSQKTIKSVMAMSNAQYTLFDTAERLNVSQSRLTTMMREQALAVDRTGRFYDSLTGQFMNNDKAISKLRRSTTRFHGEYLSLMFAGMALERTFGGILRSQLELWGLTEAFSSTIQVVMIPVMEMLLEPLLAIMDWFMNLPEPVQKAIGIFVVLGAIVGTLLTFFGGLMVLLTSIASAGGLGAVIPGFAALGSAIGGVTTFIGGLGATFAVAAIAIIAIIIGIVDAWRNNFMNMKNIVSDLWNGVKMIFGGLFTTIKGIFQVLYGLLTGNTDIFIEGLKNVFMGLFTFIKGIFLSIGAFIATVVVGAINVVKNIIMTVIDAIGRAISKIKEFFKLGEKAKDQSYSNTSFQSKPLGFDTGGVVPGPRGAAVPAIVHAGETILPTHKGNASLGNNITINPVYYVNVADKAEFERMLRNNNIKLTEDIRRQINS